MRIIAKRHKIYTVLNALRARQLMRAIFLFENMNSKAWRDRSVVKNTCFLQRTRVQFPNGSPLSIISIPGNPVPYSNLPGHHACKQALIHIK